MNSGNFRPHAAHRGRSEMPRLGDFPLDKLPSHLLHPDSEPVCELLEELDDVIFSAVSGDDKALEEAYRLWPQVLEVIGWELVEESREQYLRFAIDVTQRLEREEKRTPESAVAALEIISLLSR